MQAVWLCVLAFAAGAVVTGLLRRYALARSVIDLPNDRSSHTAPTPRGGGLSFVLVLVTMVFFMVLGEGRNAALGWGIVCGGGIIAATGFLDDHGHIRARWRLVAHFAGAAVAVASLGGFPPLSALGITFDLGLAGSALAAVYLVWLLNLYNFMDGIDGIAGVEAITVSVGAGVLYLVRQPGGDEGVLLAVLGGGVGGFLVWNFPKARIFMGDAGSGFLGIVFGILSIEAAWRAPELFWAWLILLGAFIVDATVTLFRRVLRGDKFYEAHRSHAYQYAARKLGGHPQVTLAVGAINLFWLLPVAILVSSGHLDGLVGLLVAYMPLIWLAFRFKAGARELQEC